MSFTSTLRSCIVGAAIVVVGAASGQQAREISIGLSSASFGTAAARIAKEWAFTRSTV